jgi:hypothetical protein
VQELHQKKENEYLRNLIDWCMTSSSSDKIISDSIHGLTVYFITSDALIVYFIKSNVLSE